MYPTLSPKIARRYGENEYGLDMSAFLRPLSSKGTDAKTRTMPRRHQPTGYVDPMPNVSQTPSSKEVETEAHTKSRKCRFYRRDKTAKQKDDDNDDNSITSEEEILSDLDEEALSQLPLYLQSNMRAIHAERVQQWQKENKFGRKRSQRERQHRYLQRKREEPKREQEADSESDIEPRENECSKYVEMWFKNLMAKVAATREQDARVLQGANTDSLGSLQDMTWCPVRHTWVPAYFGQIYGEKSTPTDGCGVEDRSPSNRARLCGIGSREVSPTSEAETVAEKDYFPPRPNNGYMWWRCSGPYYELEAGALQKGGQGEKQFAKKTPTMAFKGV